MPWKHNGRIIKEGKAWIAADNSKKPGTWASWTLEKKKASGLVWEDPPASEEPFDVNFYSGRKTDGTLIEKSLTDVNVVDADGKKVKDAEGNQVVIPGLKSIWVNRTKLMAQEKLNKHDWMIIRKSEKGTAIPSNVTTYRDAIRTKCTSIEKAINDCSSLADFIKLFDAPSLEENAPINDFPKEI